MSLQDKVGIEKFVYKANAADVNILGEKMGVDFDTVIQKLTRNTARGTLNRTGNKMVEFTIPYSDPSIRSAIEADEGNLNNLEIWQLGSTVADETIPDLDLIWQDGFIADPESEDFPYEIIVRRVWNG